MSSYFEDHWYDSIAGPVRWMLDAVSRKLWSAVIGPLDTLRDAAVEAENCNFVGHCPEDAVPYHARSRLLFAIDGESLGAYRARIKDAWSFWAEMGPAAHIVDGVPRGLRAALRDYLGLTALEVYDFANDDWSGGYNAAIDDDDNGDNASRLAIVIPQPHPWERPVLPVDVGPETIVGTTMTVSEQSRVRRMFRHHRPAHLVGIDIYTLFDGTSAADVLADHDASSDYIRQALGPYGMVGYQHHGMLVGPTMTVGEQRI